MTYMEKMLSRHATDDSMEHAYCMMDTYGYKHTLRICNTYCFSNATTVARTRLDVTLHVRLPELLSWRMSREKHATSASLQILTYSPFMTTSLQIQCDINYEVYKASLNNPTIHKSKTHMATGIVMQ